MTAVVQSSEPMAAIGPCLEPLEPRLLMAATDVALIGSSSVEGIVGSNSFRRPLWRTLRDAGYDVNFVGSKTTNKDGSTPPNNDFDRDNDGRSGWHAGHFLTGKDGVPKLADLLKGNSSDGVAYTPDIAILYVGHNDIFNNQTPASTADEISQILDVLRADNPNVTIILGLLHNTMWGQPGYKSIPNANANADIADLNARLITLATQKNTSTSRVVTVDLNTGFNAATMTTDGQHATSTGEEFLAGRLYSRIISFLTAQPAQIVVTPTSGSGGLTTTEAGGQASFTVVLSRKPTFNVTITLSSSDTTEGTINKSTLTFTAANWNQAQTVTITGKDDTAQDGNTSYHIVTNTASSTDPAFDGINPANVQVVNLDDEVPPDSVGNTLDTAARISLPNGPITVTERVGNTDQADFYRVRIKNPSKLRIRLNGLFADARVQIFNKQGVRMRRRTGLRLASRRIDADLIGKGVYFIRVFSRDGLDTPYNLRLIRKNLA